MSVQAQLTTLEASGLILLARLEPEVEYLFRHALVQEAAYFSLVKMDRRRLHRAVGETLERLAPGEADALGVAPLLAHHFDEAGDAARALRYYTAAGEAAAGMYANAEAIEHYRRALALATGRAGDRALARDLFLRLGQAYELNAQDAAALRNYEAMEAWALAGGDEPARLAALAARATIYVKPSIEQNPVQGWAISQQALALAQALGDRAAEAKVRWNLLQHHLITGQVAEALAEGERALAIARAEGLREQVAYVLTDLLKVYYQVQQQERALAALEEARELWRELGRLNMLADNLGSTSMVHVLNGEYDQALAVSAEAAVLSRRIGNLWNQAYAYYLVDLVHLERGELGRAIEIAELAGQLSEQAGFAEGVNQAHLDLALIYAEAGVWNRALAKAQEARARAAGVGGAMPSLPQMEGLLAYVNAAAGRLAEAQAVLDASPYAQNPALLREQFILTRCLFVQAQIELALARGDPARALAKAADIRLDLRQAGMRLYLADTHLAEARAHHAAGRPEAARAALLDARAEAEALGSRRALWQIAALQARVEAECGHTAAAEAFRREAEALVEYMVARAGSEEVAEAFRERAGRVTGNG